MSRALFSRAVNYVIKTWYTEKKWEAIPWCLNIELLEYSLGVSQTDVNLQLQNFQIKEDEVHLLPQEEFVKYIEAFEFCTSGAVKLEFSSGLEFVFISL